MFLFDSQYSQDIPKESEVESFPVYFRFVMTTQRLMKNALKNKHICADATYKLIWLNFRKFLMQDICSIQLAENYDMFLQSFQLFKTKWLEKNNKTVNTFIKYFEEQWIKINFNWFEGAYSGVPSHDNGLESTNRYIKDYHTFKRRLSLTEFLACLIVMVRNWSKDRDSSVSDRNFFYEVPPLDTRLWTYSFQFAKSNFPVISTKQIEAIIFAVI